MGFLIQDPNDEQNSSPQDSQSQPSGTSPHGSSSPMDKIFSAGMLGSINRPRGRFMDRVLSQMSGSGMLGGDGEGAPGQDEELL